MKEPLYAERLGDGMTSIDVLDVSASNPLATLVADLAAADAVPSDRFDCFILTQTLQLIYDAAGAVRHVHRLLRPGGVVLATVPVASRITDQRGLDYWRFTPAACSRLFGDVFGPGCVAVHAHGNVLACIAFLAGMAQEELTPAELDFDDPRFPLLVTIRAVKDGDRQPQISNP